MYDVTDAVFRQIIAKYSRPHGPTAMFTEFVSVHGLDSVAAHKMERELWFEDVERPLVAQIFGTEPTLFEKAARRCAVLGFDAIDINMGCPVSKVLKEGSCSALIDTPELAKEIVLATKQGAGDVPVSVKTRIGVKKIETERWISDLLEVKPAAITVHGRTSKELSKVPCHWDEIGKAVMVAKGSGIPIVGNGDVIDMEDARKKVAEYGVDGVMLGRAIFGNPWLFAEHIPTVEEKLRVCIEHTRLFETYYGENSEFLKEKKWPSKNFNIMKKHYKAYVNGFDGAKELRITLMAQKDADGVEAVINNFLGV